MKSSWKQPGENFVDESAATKMAGSAAAVGGSSKSGRPVNARKR